RRRAPRWGDPRLERVRHPQPRQPTAHIGGDHAPPLRRRATRQRRDGRCGGVPMTAATAERVSTRPEATNATAGTGTLLRLILRRDRVRIPLWVGGIAFVQIAGASSYPELLPTLNDRLAHASVMTANPAMKAMTGPGHGLDGDPSLGAL